MMSYQRNDWLARVIRLPGVPDNAFVGLSAPERLTMAAVPKSPFL
jgi:hypothetical protein